MIKIPAQYLPVMPYLILRQSQEFLEFTKTVFNASEQMIVPGDDGREIMHGEIRIGEAVIMFAQAGGQWGEKPSGMFIYIDSVDEIFEKAMRAGAKPLQQPEDKDYGYSAGFEDPFGNQWWIVESQQ